MALPQGVRLMQNVGDPRVYAVGSAGRWHIPNPTEAARLFGADWAKSVERVVPGQFDQLKDYGTFDEAMRAQPAPGTPTAAPGAVGGSLPGLGAPNPSAGDYGFGTAFGNFRELENKTYTDVLRGYQDTLGQQATGAQGIQDRYGALSQQVLAGLTNAEAGQKQAIQDLYAQQRGKATQSLTNRGLGNTTVVDSVARGLTADQAKAETSLAGDMAKMRAGYSADLGTAGLGYAGSALSQRLGLLGQQLGWMDTFRQKAPDPAQYAGLSQEDKRLAQQLQLFYQQNSAQQQQQLMDANIRSALQWQSMGPNRSVSFG